MSKYCLVRFFMFFLEKILFSVENILKYNSAIYILNARILNH